VRPGTNRLSFFVANARLGINPTGLSFMANLRARLPGSRPSAADLNSAVTTSTIPFAKVESGEVNPDAVPPSPPDGSAAWTLFTAAMSDRRYTRVQGVGGDWFLGWIWQRN
jgi:hypothetical protein